MTVKPHFIRTEPDLSQEFCGVKFTKEDKEMLKNTGNLGRVVEITDANGNKIPLVCQHRPYDRRVAGFSGECLYPRIKSPRPDLSPKEIAILKSGKQLPRSSPTPKERHTMSCFNTAQLNNRK